MSDEPKKPRLSVADPESIQQQDEEQQEIDKEVEQLIAAEATEGVQQLRHFRNLKIYLDKMVGKQWLLLYRREDDGAPIYVPNQYLSPEDQVFLAELGKNVIFQMMRFEGQED